MTGSNVMRFFSGAEGARLDASGNLPSGTTNTLPAINNVEGIALSTGSFGGRLEVSRDGAEAVSINRKTDDGSLMSFKKDGSAVGSIGAVSGYLYVGGTAGDDRKNLVYRCSRKHNHRLDTLTLVAQLCGAFAVFYLSGN